MIYGTLTGRFNPFAVERSLTSSVLTRGKYESWELLLRFIPIKIRGRISHPTVNKHRGMVEGEKNKSSDGGSLRASR